jgi:hypothetical protein
VMEARGGFKRRESILRRPVARVVQQQAQLHANLQGVNADVLLGQAVLACLTPDIAKQPLVQRP